jgi:hypothetical protein
MLESSMCSRNTSMKSDPTILILSAVTGSIQLLTMAHVAVKNLQGGVKGVI